MKRVIRYGVFESNSSSSHTLCFTNKDAARRCTLDILHDENEWAATYEHRDADTLNISFGEFGWGFETFIDEYTKLKYALTMTAETEDFRDEESFYETEGFKAINELIKEKTEFKNGVKMNDEFKLGHSFGGHKPAIDGYIDHQSYEDYKCLQDFLDDYGVTLERFIFDPDVILVIDNDNH